MKGLTLLAVLPATVWAAAFPQADYDSGLVHERIMKSKHVWFALYGSLYLAMLTRVTYLVRLGFHEGGRRPGS